MRRDEEEPTVQESKLRARFELDPQFLKDASFSKVRELGKVILGEPNREREHLVWGAYLNEERLCSCNTFNGVIHEIRKAAKQRPIKQRILVLVVESDQILPQTLRQAEPDQYQYRLRQAYEWIEEAKRRGDEQQLSDLIAVARSKSPFWERKLGDKATPDENRRMVEVLRQLRSRPGEPMKVFLQDDIEDVEGAARSFNTRLRRFCIRVYETWYELGQPDCREWRSGLIWTSRSIAQGFKRSCGFDLPAESHLLEEALKRGKEYIRRAEKRRASPPSSRKK